MRESLMYGSVRGARGNSRPYRDRRGAFIVPSVVVPQTPRRGSRFPQGAYGTQGRRWGPRVRAVNGWW